MGIMFDTRPWKEQSPFFWKFVLREALHGKASLGMFSDKSVEAFLGRIKSDKMREGWLQCRRDYAVYLRQDGKVFILFPDAHPFQKTDQFEFSTIIDPVAYGKEVSVGPWRVLATIVNDNNHSQSVLLSQKAIPSWEQFMEGCVEYYVEVPLLEDNRTPRPLVFVPSYDKQSRPEAWKRTDLKLQTTLPLLGNDSEAIFQLLANDKEEYITATIKVVLRVCRD